MFFPGRATACARLLEVNDRKCVIGHGLFDGESQCTAVLRAIMVSLNEETHRSMPFEPVVRTALEKFAASKDGLGS
jgi:acyl-CoA thioester hydrolase